jgi:mycofactocin system glycosyltransferase
VLVVDDGSQPPVALDLPHVRVLRRPVAGGPGAARQDGLALVETAVVVCLDSDVVVGAGWLEPLLAHLADPRVAAVAPRVRPAPTPSLLGRYLQGRSPLDLGTDDLPVRPGSPLSYVPSAALVLRRPLAGFDPALRYGEDVDLVWRLIAAGHEVRYEPRVTVTHSEPLTWRAALRRRRAYGTAAGPLAVRHPGQLAHLRAAPLPLAAACMLVLAPPPVALAAVAATAAATAGRLHRAGLPSRDAAALAAAAIGHATLGLGRYAAQLALPFAVLAAARRPRVALLLVAPAGADWLRRRPPLDPVRFVLAALVDDVAYGSGVWQGAWRARTLGPLLPAVGGRRAWRRPGRAGSRPCPSPPLGSPTSG